MVAFLGRGLGAGPHSTDQLEPLVLLRVQVTVSSQFSLKPRQELAPAHEPLITSSFSQI